MRRHLFATVCVALLLLALFATSAAAYPTIYSWTSQPATGQVTFSFSHHEWGGVVADPQWTGYDVYRRTLDDCDSWVRLNDQPYARQSGDYQYSFTDAPAAGHAYQYEVKLVDTNRQEVSVSGCECSRFAYATLDLATPITQGRLVDWGWAGFIEPCLGSCLPSAYISPLPTELAAYVGTNTTLRFYGRIGCGSVEGCAMEVDHFDVSACETVPTRHTSWGQVKTIYR